MIFHNSIKIEEKMRETYTYVFFDTSVAVIFVSWNPKYPCMLDIRMSYKSSQANINGKPSHLTMTNLTRS